MGLTHPFRGGGTPGGSVPGHRWRPRSAPSAGTDAEEQRRIHNGDRPREIRETEGHLTTGRDRRLSAARELRATDIKIE